MQVMAHKGGEVYDTKQFTVSQEETPITRPRKRARRSCLIDDEASVEGDDSDEQVPLHKINTYIHLIHKKARSY